MSVEVLSILSTKDNYDRFSRFIKGHTVEAEVFTIIKDMGVWYEKHTTMEWDKFSVWFKMRHPKLNAEAMSIYDRLLHKVQRTEVNDNLMEDIVESFVRKDFLTKASDKMLTDLDGGGELDVRELELLITEYYNEVGMVNSLEQYEVTDDLEQLVKNTESGGFNWKLKFLNQAIGTARKGKLIIIGARPNSGKTTLMCQEFMEWAKQAPNDHVLLWFNNEEEGVDVRWRQWEALLETSKTTIEAHPAKAKAKIVELIGTMGKVRLIDKSNVSIEDVYSYIKKYDGKVSGIVFDQLWKVRGMEKSSSTDVDRQQKIFAWARGLAKQYCPVITSHQLKGDAEGVMYPDMSMLYGSTTAIQGEADVIIMLGTKNEMGLENTRGISIAKVKGAYGPHVIPSMRNAKKEIILHPERALFTEE
jgi:replicative DNA helicase